MTERLKLAVVVCVACTFAMVQRPNTAEAFCGFYVADSPGSLLNEATDVVLMRSGKRTVLSMRNSYKGPPRDFAMVVPVPVVLERKQVRTLQDSAFERLKRFTAPRLVEYHEANPCPLPVGRGIGFGRVHGLGTLDTGSGMGAKSSVARAAPRPPPVRVKARFAVDEYDIVILDADDSTSLVRWLKEHDYKLPPRAQRYLNPYIEGGSYFFVVKVDVERLKFDGDGRAALSPIRFYYDSDEFTLPTRLGLINAKGPQELVVHILGDSRYQAANRKNTTIPTNLDVRPGVNTGERFAAFYRSLFKRTISGRRNTVVTEYAWEVAQKCDPCTGPAMNPRELVVFGLDVVRPRRMTLTRLRTWQFPHSAADDLVFSKAQPIDGGNEVLENDGKLATGAKPSARNRFQARYAIRHFWKGPVTCKDPQFGQWSRPNSARPSPKRSNTNAGPPMRLEWALRSHIPELEIKAWSTNAKKARARRWR